MIEDYKIWLEKALEFKTELEAMTEEEAEDAFYKNLEFGTGGLRGVIGAGTNRMNIYTVARATQGLANYIVKNFDINNRRVAISYDSRIKSDLFAKIVASVMNANGIMTLMYKELMPTPCLSFATRELKCAAGVMITASHNPAKYNGYKVYGSDGCQITTDAAKDILKEIEAIDIFDDVKISDFDESVKNDEIKFIPDDIYTRYTEAVRKQSVLKKENIDRTVSIVYSPLNGTGLKPILRALSESGFTNVFVVPEQKNPDGNFPTCPYPNPEIREAMSLGMKYAEEKKADLFLATDPDCDRVGIAAVDKKGEYRLLSGNEVGCLMLDYICSRRIENRDMPENPIFVKTIVTTDMGKQIADNYGVTTIDVLTGFKYIGETIGRLEADGRKDDYICGFEESYGYLTGSYVRDKDAVNGALMICEMFSYYKSIGISLIDKMEELYKKYGYRLNTLYSYEFPGPQGFEKMRSIMKKLRSAEKSLGQISYVNAQDYSAGINRLPKSDVIRYVLPDGSAIVIRPSGTEPKLKIYYSMVGEDREKVLEAESKIKVFMENFLKLS